ncbi:uncharacterized protein LOC134677331 [Cydia fagiglandana]|uniref:uncharacterized protein LOC134677331 n=1 Tax=Cydia fagiglandana TaxID=1458189 RepID=UPI002FEE0F3C
MGRTNKAAYKKRQWSGGKRKRRQVEAALLHHYGTKSRTVAWRNLKVNNTLTPESSNAQEVINNDSTSADTRIDKKRDATSSTTVDNRRRVPDPTPAHLKYGTFRRLSKLQQCQEDKLLSPRCESRPIYVARSSVPRRSPSPKDPLKIERNSISKLGKIGRVGLES